MGLTTLAKRVVLAGTIAAGGYLGFKGHEAYNKYQVSKNPVHDQDTFILHLQKGSTLGDVELLYDETDAYDFNGWAKMGGISGAYLIDPAQKSDADIADIIKDIEKDRDVLDAEFNLQLSIPEGEAEEKGTIKKMGDSLWQKLNQYVPLQKGIEGAREAIDKVTSYFSDAAKPREDINDPIYKEGKLWGQMVTGMDRLPELLQEYGLTADDLSEVKVYVLDTGCDATHEDLLVTADKKDGHGHGTHVAGTIGALTNNEKGVSSIDAEGVFDLNCIPVLSESGTGDLYTISQAIVKAADAGADVINMSLGGPGKSTLLEKAIKYADDKGTIVVVAAGNSNTDAKNFSPANVEEAITIGAVGYDKDEGKQSKAPFSNYGTTVDVCAPGMEILSTIPLKSNIGKQRPDKIYKPGYMELQGTSMASPHVASLVGMLKAVNPELSREGIVRILQETGTEPETDKGKPIGKCIDAYAAVKKALDLAMEWELYEE